MRSLLVVAIALALAGCAEHQQRTEGVRGDATSFTGTDRQPPFMAAGWQAGERDSWERHLKLRTLHQNEYLKVQ